MANSKFNKLNIPVTDQSSFFEEQLFEAKRALFSASTVREVKFLQNRIKYLRERVKELNGKY